MADKGTRKVKFTFINWALISALVILVGLSVVLFWQGAMSFAVLLFWILGLVVIGLLFVFGVRDAQKDGYVDGFRDGRDGVKSG